MAKFSYDLKKLPNIFSKLEKLYNKIPSTTGCMDSIKNKKCNAFCCIAQNPQLLYCEFLHAWDEILKEWEMDDVLELIRSALSMYLYNHPIKGCIVHNRVDKKCSLHNFRPLSCRSYGITPDEEFNKRLEKVKEQNPELAPLFRPQCKFVSTENGSEVTMKDTDDWWEALVDIEKSLGVPPKNISDSHDGTYRTFHDHILLFLLPELQFENLSHARMHGTQIEKDTIIEKIVDIFRTTFLNLGENDSKSKNK